VSGIVEAAGAVCLAGVAASIAALGYLHGAETGLSPVRNAVSQYGISPHRVGYRVLTISMAVSGASLALALDRALHGAGVATVIVLLGVFSVARLAISWVPMDAPGAARTSTGAAHGLLAVATFLSIAIAAIRLCRVLGRDLAWIQLGNVSRGFGWAMVACFGLMMLSRIGPDLRRAFGVIERALYVAILAWLVAIGVACATGQL
jgi:hypothetical protein